MCQGADQQTGLWHIEEGVKLCEVNEEAAWLQQGDRQPEVSRTFCDGKAYSWVSFFPSFCFFIDFFFINELKCQAISALQDDSKGIHEKWAPEQTQGGMFGYLGPHSSAEARVGFSVGPWACSGTGYCSQAFPQQRMPLKEFFIPIPLKAHFKTTVVLDKEERIQASPITSQCP